MAKPKGDGRSGGQEKSALVITEHPTGLYKPKGDEAERFARFCTMFVPPAQREQRFGDALAEFADEFCRNSLFAEFAITDDAMFVGTSRIFGDSKGRRKDIGQFMFTVSRTVVEMENLSHPIQTPSGIWHAPHISYNKTVCGLSDYHSRLSIAIAGGKLAQAFGLMAEIAGKCPGYYAPAMIDKWPDAK